MLRPYNSPCCAPRGELPCSSKALLEPMRRVRIGVERRHWAIPGARVQRDRLLQRPVGFEPQRGDAKRPRLVLGRLQHVAPDPEPARAVSNPHALEGPDARGGLLHAPTRHRLPVDRRDEERAARRDEVAIVGGKTGPRIKSAREPSPDPRARSPPPLRAGDDAPPPSRPPAAPAAWATRRRAGRPRAGRTARPARVSRGGRAR